MFVCFKLPQTPWHKPAKDVFFQLLYVKITLPINVANLSLYYISVIIK